MVETCLCYVIRTKGIANIFLKNFVLCVCRHTREQAAAVVASMWEMQKKKRKESKFPITLGIDCIISVIPFISIERTVDVREIACTSKQASDLLLSYVQVYRE